MHLLPTSDKVSRGKCAVLGGIAGDGAFPPSFSFFSPFPIVDLSRYIYILYIKYTKDFKSDPGPIHAIVNKDGLRISIGDVIVARPDHPITCRSLQNGPIVAESSNTSDRLNSHLVNMYAQRKYKTATIDNRTTKKKKEHDTPPEEDFSKA